MTVKQWKRVAGLVLLIGGGVLLPPLGLALLIFAFVWTVLWLLDVK